MSPDVVRRVADEVLSSDLVEAPIVFLWHLGEPLSVPPPVYEEFFQIIASANNNRQREYIHSFQTNATLLDARWVDFIRRHQVRLGVSIDGPAFLHDRQRITRGGRGTHAAVLRGIRLLQASNVPFGVISVLTDFALDYADEFFGFFLDNKIEDIGFNIDEIEGVHASTSFGDERTFRRYRDFLLRLIHLSERHNGAVKLREIWTNLRTLAIGSLEPYNTTNQPFRILNFDASGNFNTFCPELMSARSLEYHNFVMGNILHDGLADLFVNQIFQRVNAEIKRGVAKCQQSCSHWSFCGGGSPSNKFFEHGRFDVAETTTCRIHKKETVDVLVDYLEMKLAGGLTPDRVLTDDGEARGV